MSRVSRGYKIQNKCQSDMRQLQTACGKTRSVFVCSADVVWYLQLHVSSFTEDMNNFMELVEIHYVLERT